MEQFNVPPTPENYAVWVSFATDNNPELCNSIKTRIETNEEFTDAVSADLFEQYFQWKAVQDAVLESGGAMSRELGAVKQALKLPNVIRPPMVKPCKAPLRSLKACGIQTA